MRQFLRPILQGKPPRPNRRAAANCRIEIKKPISVAGIVGRIVDVSSAAPSDVKIAVPADRVGDLEVAGEIEGIIILPRGSQRLDTTEEVSFSGTVVRTARNERDLKANEGALVLRIVEHRNKREWRELVKDLPEKKVLS